MLFIMRAAAASVFTRDSKMGFIHEATKGGRGMYRPDRAHK